MEHFNAKDIKRVKLWGGIIGILFIFYGIFLFIQGLFSYVIGALPGVAAILMGKYIHDTRKEAQEIIQSKGNTVRAVDNMMRYISLFLLLAGILTIMIIVLYVLFLMINMYYN